MDQVDLCPIARDVFLVLWKDMGGYCRSVNIT